MGRGLSMSCPQTSSSMHGPLVRLPVNAQLGAYYNVLRPDGAAEWQLRVQIQLLFPK